MRLMSLIIAAVVGCGEPSKVADSAAPYVQEFQRLTGEQVDFYVIFKQQTIGIGGVCYRGDWGRWVELDPYLWDNPPNGWGGSPEAYREYVVFHELFHCTKGGLEHASGTVQLAACDGFLFDAPASMMNPSIPDEACIYIDNRQYYLSTLGI